MQPPYIQLTAALPSIYISEREPKKLHDQTYNIYIYIVTCMDFSLSHIRVANGMYREKGDQDPRRGGHARSYGAGV